ncbi:MAG TPA: outer membrane protein assembly factor BamA [Terriglobia bacterium]|nr:outer membrane protein assembly factor BamA [Terriglobia bacterium]
MFKLKRLLVAVCALVSVLMLSVVGSSVHAQNIGSGDPIQEIRVEGNQRIEPETIRSYMQINPGDPFDAEKIDQALKNLFATGLFADVNLRRDGNALVVAVKENPIINKLAFEGNKRIDDDALNAEVQLRPRVVYTQTRVQQDVKRILDLYRRSGRFAATVEPKIIKLDQNRVNLVFEIHEGDITYVRRIDFVGNKVFSDSDLRDVILTRIHHWYLFLTNADAYDPDRLTVDKEQLRQFYLTEGYADFRVVSAVAELSPEQDAFFITFNVEEGERYKFGKIDIKTTLKGLNPETLRGDVTTKEGDWYDASRVQDTVKALSDRLGNLGYAFVDVRPRIDRDAKKRILTLTYDIQEGPKVYVERIDISGNVRTQDKVIRREFRLAEGDAFSTEKMQRTEQRLKNLDFFESVDISEAPGSTPDKTIIKVKVQEKSTGSLSFGAGFSTSDGPLGTVGVQERNLLGKGQDLAVQVQISGKRSGGTITFTDPYFLDKEMSATFGIFHQRYQAAHDRFRQLSTGFTTSIGYDVTEYTRHTLGYTFSADDIYHIDNDASQVIKDDKGYEFRSTLKSNLLYDRRDAKFDPRAGYYVNLETDYTGLGGTVYDAKGVLSGGYFYPFNRSKTVSLGVTGQAGYIQPLFGDFLHYADSFKLGGQSLRGFADNGVGPRDEDAKQKDGSIGGKFMFSGTVSLGFPLGLPEEYQIRGRAFSDFGLVTDPDPDSHIRIRDNDLIRVSAGIGLTWVSPFGPLAVDVALPLRKDGKDQTELFNFSVGTSF